MGHIPINMHLWIDQHQQSERLKNVPVDKNSNSSANAIQANHFIMAIKNYLKTTMDTVVQKKFLNGVGWKL